MPAPDAVTVPPLARLVGASEVPTILVVRPPVDFAADLRLDLAPEAAGLPAASLGLPRMHRDDLAQLDAGMAPYDAFHRWARDATGETHDWPAPAPSREPQP